MSVWGAQLGGAVPALQVVAGVIGVTLLLAGAIRLLTVPFGLVFELRRRRAPGRAPAHRRSGGFAEPPLVSIVVPAYDEAVVLENCLRSVATTEHPRVEVICVDDGSTDETLAVATRLARELPGLTVVHQENAGKGAALNAGIALAHGDVVMLVDADGVFRPDTVSRMLEGFVDPRVGAVCGNDRPVNLDRVQTRFLALIGHLGTGLMRRAMDELHCLPIVSGNIGAFRREALSSAGPLREDTVGEDLELTWRIYRAGYRVAFAPRALVYAESPSTFRGLWRQRVRWARGLLQTVRRHPGLVGNPRYGMFGLYLGFVVLSQVVVPVLQGLAVVALATLAASGDLSVVPVTFWAWVVFLGLPLSLALLVLAVGVDRAWRDLRFGWTLPLWPLYSAAMTAVMWRALWLEAKGAENRWNKLERTGTVSIGQRERAAGSAPRA